MEFLQPYMLWGLAAVAIPVAVHFWYQKRGKTIAWAATDWLTDKTTLQHRGLRLDEIPLMLLRCLLVILFVALLGKPFLSGTESNKSGSKIHLIEPNIQLINNFRFELEKAIKNGEKVFYIGSKMDVFHDISSIPDRKNEELFLQSNITSLVKPDDELNLYITSSDKWAQLQKIYVPSNFKLHSITDSTDAGLTDYLDTGNDKKLFVDQETGQLKVVNSKEAITRNLAASPVHTGAIKVLVSYKNETERQNVQAALLSLAEVYSVIFDIDLTSKSNTKYDWILTDENIKYPQKNTLHVLSNAGSNPADNVFQIQDSLRLSTSALVQNGRLPEWLGEIMVAHYKLNPSSGKLSEQQLETRFVQQRSLLRQTDDKLYQWLLIFFITTLILERWIALRKNGSQTYA